MAEMAVIMHFPVESVRFYIYIYILRQTRILSGRVMTER